MEVFLYIIPQSFTPPMTLKAHLIIRKVSHFSQFHHSHCYKTTTLYFDTTCQVRWFAGVFIPDKTSDAMSTSGERMNVFKLTKAYCCYVYLLNVPFSLAQNILLILICHSTFIVIFNLSLCIFNIWPLTLSALASLLMMPMLAPLIHWKHSLWLTFLMFPACFKMRML